MAKPFSVTFLGHQGWMFSDGDCTILVDPLLHESFGLVPAAGLKVFPPRQLCMEACPPLAGVIFTHEHEDHFQTASLLQLPRTVPLWLSDRMSWAAKKIAEHLGFEVHSARRGDCLKFGAMRVMLHIPDLVSVPVGYEIDVLPFEVLHENGGRFLSAVDLPLSPRFLRERARDGCPGLWTYANNEISLHSLTDWMPCPAGSLRTARSLMDLMAAFARMPARPGGLLASGGGWSFSGPLEQLNRTLFPCDNETLARIWATARVAVAPTLTSPLPGETIGIEGSRWFPMGVGFQDFLTAAPRVEWPDRTFDPTLARATSLPPLLEEGPLATDQLAEMELRLAALAQDLVGSPLCLSLLSLSPAALEGLRRCFALFAQTSADGDGYLYEFDPSACRFTRVSSPRGDHAAGCSLWAADLLATLAGRLTPALVTMGHMFEWVRAKTDRPEGLSLQPDLWRLVHPLRMPEEFFTGYLGNVQALMKIG
jgi:hypothetical protein